jgi:superoxide dismutase, Fe-Mn family
VNADNYYVVGASALEERIDLFRVLAGKMERIGGTGAEVALNHWHKLGLVAQGDQFTVSLDNEWLFTVWDRTFDRWPYRPLDGRRQRHAVRSVKNQGPAMVGGALMTYRIKPLSCDPAKIKGMSERLIVSHYENNYGGAVKRLNLIDEQLAELDYTKAAGFLINGLKREQLVAMNSMILHELFFDGLGDQSEPGPALRDALAQDFGSFERWRAEFVAMGKALGGGSGWVLLSWSPRDRKLVNQWASDHCHTLAGGTPILALDMYEHSYHIDFGAKAASYVDTFIEVIRWNNVEQLFVRTTSGRGTGGDTRQ